MMRTFKTAITLIVLLRESSKAMSIPHNYEQ